MLTFEIRIFLNITFPYELFDRIERNDLEIVCFKGFIQAYLVFCNLFFIKLYLLSFIVEVVAVLLAL